MEKSDIRILLVDDEPDILEFLSFNLEKEGYQVMTAEDGQTAWEVALSFDPDLFILDIMMPRMNGVELCRKLRDDHRFEDKLITFLTAKSGEQAEVESLDAGADDFITKPITPKLFISRVQAILRRLEAKNGVENKIIKLGKLTINTDSYEVLLDGSNVALARKEFELLRLLASKPGKVFTRQEILNNVWGSDVIVVDRTVDVHIRKLRGKLGDHFIKTLKGVGYKFNL